MQKKELTAFFNGAYDMMGAAFRASEELSSASKGAMRERAARQLFAAIIPPALRIETGDIIDSSGRSSGQLDGIVLEHHSPALKLAADDTALVLAESAVAVLEFKSDLGRQWDQVRDKFERIAALRPAVLRMPPPAEFKKMFPRSMGRRYRDRLTEQVYGVKDEQKRIPIVIVGHKSWTDPKRLLAEFVALQKRHHHPPPTFVVSLVPPALVAPSHAHGAQLMQPTEPGDVLAMPWFFLVAEAQRIVRFRRFPWARYVGGPRTAELQGDSHVDWITQEPLDIDD